MAFRLRGRIRLYGIGGTVLVGLITIAITMTYGGTDTELTQLSSAPLGVNIGPWDYAYAANISPHHYLDEVQRLLKAATIRQLRYGGGSYADFYNWQTNTNIGNCLPDDPTASFTSSCASSDPLSFARFSQQARVLDADSFVTVNYGSGTPAEAAAWVAEAKDTPGERVALWEVGNESYGCWEVNNELADAPEHYLGYRPSISETSGDDFENPSCPWITEGNVAGTQTLAASYAVNARQFLIAMKTADSAARIGVPWAFGDDVPGAYVPDSSEWNKSVLQADGKYISFVDVHYYPFWFSGKTGGKNPTDMQVLQSLTKIPLLYNSIRAQLSALAPGASIVVGETAVSSGATSTTCTPEGAVFAAGDALSWLAAGAQSVDWWNMIDQANATSTCVNPGFGLFTSSSPPKPETSYYGYFLASLLAQPHAMLGKLITSDPSDVLAFQATETDGKHAIAFININTRSPEKVTFRPDGGLSGMLRTWSYGAANQNSEDSKITTKSVPATTLSNGVRLPADSILVLETY